MNDGGNHEQQTCEGISKFMALMDRDPPGDFADLRTLALALDNLVAIYFRTTEVDPEGEADAPARDYAGFYQRAGKAYPELGLYPYAYPGDDPGEKVFLVADAIDDLADIVGDLDEVLWHFDNSTAEEAIWHFRLGYQHHWGDHLHSLRSYLHSSRIAAW